MINIKDNNTRTVIFIGLAGSAAYVISKSSYVFTPIILSSLMKGLDLSATRSGFLMSQEMLAVSLSTMALATIIGKVSKQKMFMGGFLLLLLGFILTAASDSLAMIMVARMMVGIGGGMVAAVANAAISSSADPERGFGIALTVSGVLSAILMPLLTGLSDRYAHIGVFLCLALIAILLAPFCRLLFRNDISESKHYDIPTSRSLLPYITLVAIFLYFCVLGSAWAFARQIAIQANVESGIIGYIFAAATLVGISGGVVASFLSTRIGRIKPILGAGIMQILLVFVLTTSSTTFEFTASLLCVTTLLYFVMPYIYGVAAMFGENGRWGVAGGGAGLLGIALSSSVGGLLVDWAGYKMIGIAFAISGSLSIMILIFVIIQNSKSDTSVPVKVW